MAEQMGLLANIGQGLQRKFGRIGNALSGQDQNARDRLALGLMSLGNPNQTQAIQQLVANRLEERKKQTQTNKSIEYLKTIDPRLAALAENNPSMVGSIFSEIAKRQLNPQQAKIETGADGFKYYITGPNAGQRVLPGQLTDEDQAIMNLQSRLGVDAQTAANMFYQQQGFTLPGANNQTVTFLEEKAAAGDENAKAALLLVGPKGAGEAMKTYINATSGRAQPNNQTAAKTDTYLNGVVVNSFQDGTRQVLNNLGEEVTGEEAARVIDEANAYNIEQARLTKFAEASASSKAKMVGQTISSLVNVDSTIQNYGRAKSALRRALNEGREISGLAQQFFPDITVEAAELTNARNALGLDVVGSVTFGALSKGELDLALTQGLPLGLSGKPLLEYIERRELALGRYRASLVEAARYQSDPNLTMKDYVEQMSAKSKEIENPYKTVSDDDLEKLAIEVMSGDSTLSARSRQLIIDEVDRRAGL